uniref:Uncharacterized protein n=1 Tax=Panagrolaimus superbus TaxID=310955 RepID=A0A914Y8C3_9BILA
MANIEVDLLIVENGKLVSRGRKIYQMSDNDTVANVIDYFCSSNEFPQRASIKVLLKRYVDQKLHYNIVQESFTINRDDAFEINVSYDNEETLNSDINTVELSVSSVSTNDSNVDSNYLKEADHEESTMEQFYDRMKDDIETYYESLNKQTTFITINFHNFFNQNTNRALVYLLSSKDVSKNIALINTSRDRLKRYIRKLVDVLYPNFSCTKIKFLELYSSLTNWMGSTLMANCRETILTIVWNSYLTGRWRKRKQNPDAVVQIAKKSNNKKRRNQSVVNERDYDTADHELVEIARLMRENKEANEISEMFRQTIETRYVWIQYILAHPDFEKGAAEVIIDRFPRLLDNVNYLHDDYVYYMRKHKFPVCNLGQKFRYYIPGIFKLALSLNFITSVPEVLSEIKAGEILPLLVREYIKGKAKHCCKDRYMIGSDTSINIKEILRHKDVLEITAPIIAYVKHKDSLEFYIIVDQKVLKVPGTFADALQALHELQFVMNLEYDYAVAPLFVFMEYVLGFKSREGYSRFRLKQDIEAFL